MANDLTGNPYVMDTAAVISGMTTIRQIQWVDDNADIVDGDDLVLSINGTAITIKVQMHDTAASRDPGTVVYYEAGPFNPGIAVEDFTVTTIDHGSLIVWIE